MYTCIPCSMTTLPGATASLKRTMSQCQASKRLSSAMSAGCIFTPFFAPDSLLRERRVCRIQEEYLQRHLLCEPDLTLSKSTEHARASTKAAGKIVEIRKETSHKASASGRYHISCAQPAKNQDRSCWRCNGLHAASAC